MPCLKKKIVVVTHHIVIILHIMKFTCIHLVMSFTTPAMVCIGSGVRIVSISKYGSSKKAHRQFDTREPAVSAITGFCGEL